MIVRNLCFVACLQFSVAHSVVVTYNAALNRPAFQSSVHSNPLGSYVAKLANDGIRETVASKDRTPSCAISLREANPWWAVDLGGPTTIYKVDFTNRGDGAGTCMWLFCLESCQFPLLSYSLVLFTVKLIDIILSHCVLSACHCGADESFLNFLFIFYLWIRS